MRAITIFFLLFVFHTRSLHAQREATVWTFGNSVGLDFSSDPPSVFSNSIVAPEGCASISDSKGKLLFYTNGATIWTKNHEVMTNGTGLNGACAGYFPVSSSQSSLIVPMPGNPNHYYVFTVDCIEDFFSDGLNYSIVDMSLDNGLGAVTVKNQPITAPVGEKVAAVFHSNGSDVWIVTHGVYGSNAFYAFLLTSQGIETPPVVSQAGQTHWDGGRGYLKFSPDGTRLVALSFGNTYTEGGGLNPELFRFDASTGRVTTDFVLPSRKIAYYGAAFSPNSQLLYLSCVQWTCGPLLEQFDLNAASPTEIYATRHTYPSYHDGVGSFGAIQLGIDGRLYFLSKSDFGANDFMGVVHYPDRIGLASFYQGRALVLPIGMQISWGLPNFIESLFAHPVSPPIRLEPKPLQTAWPADTALCQGSSLLLEGPDVGYNASYLWNTGLNLKNITVTEPGKYWVTVRRFNTDNGSASVELFASDTLTVAYFNCDTCQVTIPDVFTPNGDEKNDFFLPYSPCKLSAYHVNVYNRWGQLVFESMEAAKGWDGTTNGNEASSGVYFYYLTYQFPGNENTTVVRNRKGSVSLLR